MFKLEKPRDHALHIAVLALKEIERSAPKMVKMFHVR